MIEEDLGFTKALAEYFSGSLDFYIFEKIYSRNILAFRDDSGGIFFSSLDEVFDKCCEKAISNMVYESWLYDVVRVAFKECEKLIFQEDSERLIIYVKRRLDVEGVSLGELEHQSGIATNAAIRDLYDLNV